MTDPEVQRRAFQLPRPCFSTGQLPANLECPACPHKVECATYMGSRLNAVPISQTKFQLTPAELQKLTWTAEQNFIQICRECAEIIWPRRPFSYNATKHPELPAKVQARAEAAKCPLPLFILTIMWAAHQADPGGYFPFDCLGTEQATNRVNRWRSTVEEQYGVLTPQTLDAYTGEEIGQKLTAEQLLNGERIVGAWICGYRSRRGGTFINELYAANETALPDLWLASEPTYHKLLIDWQKDAVELTTSAQKKQRARLIKLVVELKKRSKQAYFVFKTRADIMPKAIELVLQDLGFNSRSFYVKPQLEWTSTLLFWARLAESIQQAWCLSYLHDGDRRALRRLQSGAAQLS